MLKQLSISSIMINKYGGKRFDKNNEKNYNYFDDNGYSNKQFSVYKLFLWTRDKK